MKKDKIEQKKWKGCTQKAHNKKLIFTLIQNFAQKNQHFFLKNIKKANIKRYDLNEWNKSYWQFPSSSMSAKNPSKFSHLSWFYFPPSRNGQRERSANNKTANKHEKVVNNLMLSHSLALRLLVWRQQQWRRRVIQLEPFQQQLWRRSFIIVT